MRTQRLDQPYLRVERQAAAGDWEEAFAAIAAKVKAAPAKRMGAHGGRPRRGRGNVRAQGADGVARQRQYRCRQPGSPLHPKYGRARYLFNSTIAGIDQADAIMLIGTNPRHEAPVLNARIRKRWLEGGVLLGLIGEKADLTYPYNYLGAGPESARAIPRPRAGRQAKSRCSSSARARSIVPMAPRCWRWRRRPPLSLGVVKDGWNGFNILHSAASLLGALDIGFVPGEGGPGHRRHARWPRRSMCSSCSAPTRCEVPSGPFVVYIGTHGDRGAHRADVILPGAAYPEKSGLYVNTEGRVQLGNRAAFPPGDAREDWAILRALSDVLGHKLPYDSLGALRQALTAAHPHFARIDEIAAGKAADIEALAKLGGAADKTPLRSAVADFYLTNPIARASATMAECSALANAAAKTAAE